ncbi:MAG: 4Fe-4S cluster-binding domain-containing protein, partial [Desulfosarcinaceae bacterium]
MSCEINAVDHCNITCLDCNHASPPLKAHFADPDRVYHDLSTLSKVYRADWLKIVGGEPLLHPDLPSLVDAVRRSGISKKILLVTNGLLLKQMPEAVWEAIDQLELSIYPETGLDEAKQMQIQEQARSHGVHLLRSTYSNFRRTFSITGTDDSNLVRRIYRTCKLANLWGCQSIHEGHLYKCP